jgi:hypothetical protein
LMDMLVKHQERVMRALCDRFGRDLCFVAIQDDLLAHPAVVADENLFQQIILPRLHRMFTPAREHGLPTALDTTVAVEQALPGLQRTGINIIQSVNPDANSLEQLLRDWQGKMAFIGSVPVSTLAHSSKPEIEARIRLDCEKFSRQAGFAFSTSTPASSGNADFPPQNFVITIRAIQRYGKYTY